MKVPSPLNGWRIFWSEVGIIVIGVLLALGAQQVVETMSWRGQVRHFRAAVDRELVENLSIYEIRLRQNDCVSRRLAEVGRLLAKALKQAQGRNQRIHENLVISFAIGKSLGIKPIKPDGMTPEDVAATRRCPTLAQPTAS